MGKINVTRELDNCYGIEHMEDLVRFCRDFYSDLLYIKKYYEKEFNATSENLIPIDAHIEMFLRTFKQLIKSINSPKRYERLFKTGKKANAVFNELSSKISDKVDFHHEGLNNELTGEVISEPYYKKMKQFMDIMFLQEEIIAPTTQKLWHNYIAKNVNDIKKNKYCCLVKVLSDWRMENKSPKLDKYMKSRYAMSVSLITDFKSRFFDWQLSAQTVGIIYSTKKILAGCYKDAFLEEFIDDECPLCHREYSSIRVTQKEYNHKICSYASKIATPNSVLLANNRSFDTYNEVIIDKRESTPIAVFCVKREINYEHGNEQAKRTATRIAKRFGLPLIELEDKNLICEQFTDEVEKQTF